METPPVASGSVCIPNIGPAERRRRAAFGAAMLAVGIVIALALFLTRANHLWRLVLFIPLWQSALGYYQAREKT